MHFTLPKERVRGPLYQGSPALIISHHSSVAELVILKEKTRNPVLEGK